METRLYILSIAIFIFLAGSVFAVSINDAIVDELSPGEQGRISIEVENILNDDAVDIALRLDFSEVPIIPVGSSEQFFDEIEEDKDEFFVFTVRAAPDARAGDYEIPYVLTYSLQGSPDEMRTSEGTIGLRIVSQPDLTFSTTTENNVVGSQGAIQLKIVNQGFYDARFLSVKVIPNGYTLLSEDEVYIGSVESDDFETATFDVVFTSSNPTLRATVQYTDFNNDKITREVVLPVQVYSRDRALELGIIKPNYTLYYIFLVVFIIILFVVWRIVKKRRRLRRSQKGNN